MFGLRRPHLNYATPQYTKDLL